MTLVFGVGIGTFIILFLLATSFVLCCVSLRTQTKIGPIFIAFSSVFITILLLIPRSSDSSLNLHKEGSKAACDGSLRLLKLLHVSRVLQGPPVRCKSFNISSSKEFDEKVMHSAVPVVVNFHAEWCDPCHILTPKLKDLLDGSEQVDLAIVDVESNADLVHTFEVKAVPAVVAIKNGHVIDKFIGLVEHQAIVDLVKKLVNN